MATQEKSTISIIEVPVENIGHTEGYPFCDDSECPCHQDGEQLDQLNWQYREGLVSTGDMMNIYQGRTV